MLTVSEGIARLSWFLCQVHRASVALSNCSSPKPKLGSLQPTHAVTILALCYHAHANALQPPRAPRPSCILCSLHPGVPYQTLGSRGPQLGQKKEHLRGRVWTMYLNADQAGWL